MATIGPLEDVEVHVALGYYPEDSVIGMWDEDVWDDAVGAVWAGAPPLDDVSCEVVSIRISAGRDQPLDRFRTGVCTMVLDDPDGHYTPWTNAADPGKFGTIRPGIDLRVWVVTATGTYPRFSGKVDSIQDVWPEPTSQPDTPHRVIFTAHDWLGEIAQYDGFEQPPVGAGETTSQRVQRILANAKITAPQSFDPGSTTVQATTLARNALDEIGLVTDTERGAFFADGSGTLVFRDQNGLNTDPRYTTVQEVFGETVQNVEVAIPELEDEAPYIDVRFASDESKVRNVVSIAREGGTAVTVTDSASASLFGYRTYRRFDLLHQADPESTAIANAYLARFAYAVNRIEGLSTSLKAWPLYADRLLYLQPLDMIEVRRRAKGFQIVATLQIQAMEEVITATDWVIKFNTFDADSVFDVGRWNTDKWDDGLWGY